LPELEAPYWDRARETADPAERDAASLAQLQLQLQRCYRELPFYRRHWDTAGFHPDQVTSWASFTERCPLTTKEDLIADQAEHPPFGSYLGVPESEIWRIHASSGTSGTPTVYGVSLADWERAKEIFAITHWAMGVRPTDRVHFVFPFGMFFGGWAMLMAAETVGAACLPMGAAETTRHLEMIELLGCTVIEGTPSYMLHMAEVAERVGYDTRNSPLKRALVGGEPGGSIPSTRAKILDVWGLDSVCDSGTSSEMFPFCTQADCTEMNGLHVYSDEVRTEIVSVDDPHALMPEGEVGNTVYTHLWRTSQPMIRYAVADRASLVHDPCPCGRTYPRLPHGLLGRSDDMLVIRGANVYPSAIEHALRGVDGIGLEFRIRVTTNGALDEVAVVAEIADGFPADREQRAQLQRRAAAALKHRCLIRIPIDLVEPNTFERATLKAKRVIDERKVLA
jgi:phenylacetate-CoA ligase